MKMKSPDISVRGFKRDSPRTRKGLSWERLNKLERLNAETDSIGIPFVLPEQFVGEGEHVPVRVCRVVHARLEDAFEHVLALLAMALSERLEIGNMCQAELVDHTAENGNQRTLQNVGAWFRSHEQDDGTASANGCCHVKDLSSSDFARAKSRACTMPQSQKYYELKANL